ncbi:RdgB/HAM1 family non-canonical purine NTP pyrophosphatase [Tautonia rosea]|uniref:RdgB/HAM1 family non-canonical purine NTP pyrophosphatase n=1 Tax=Tautonia rosea TaxID=2728037 RepID=UPI001474DEF0|nr:RdgB/HAM1 family non-canonical purine NTP pyrophosphatase [Tautonia rosea]
MSDAPAQPFPIVLATRNVKKGREMVGLIAPPWEPNPRLARLVVLTLDGFPDAPEVVEDADTFAGNARKKASETAQSLGQWVIADDSGLTVDALDGAPGVYSARYAGSHGDDDANNRKLLAELTGVPDERRGGAFVCCLALSDPSGAIVLEAEGACRGRIAHQVEGEGGFGYDPLFIILEYHKTFGELSTLVKHQLSHRARAFERLRPGLEHILMNH